MSHFCYRYWLEIERKSGKIPCGNIGRQISMLTVASCVHDCLVCVGALHGNLAPLETFLGYFLNTVCGESRSTLTALSIHRFVCHPGLFTLLRFSLASGDGIPFGLVWSTLMAGFGSCFPILDCTT